MFTNYDAHVRDYYREAFRVINALATFMESKEIFCVARKFKQEHNL